MELQVVLLLPLCFPGLQAQTPGELSQREGSNLSVLCHYPAEDEYRELKAWCRWTDQRCQLQVATSGTRTQFYTDRARQGHFTIQDDPIHRNFSITMTDLQVEDSGTYYCAYSQSYVPLKWISLRVFKGEYLFPTQTPVLSGGNVTAALLHPPPAHSERLPPPHPSAPSFMPSLFAFPACRARGERALQTPLAPRRTAPCGPAQSVLPGLTATAWPRCPARTRRWIPLCPRLRVRHQVCCSAEFHKLELDSLSVQCPYHNLGYRSERKAWCRYAGQTGRCYLVVNTYGTYTWGTNYGQKGRASIQDDTQKRTITITVEKLQAQDSGVYWCALYRPQTPPTFTRIMEVRLSVAKRPAATTLSVTRFTSENHLPSNSTLGGQGVSTYIIISTVLYLLLIPVVIILITSCIRHHRKLKRRGNRQAEDIYDKPEDTTQLESTERMETPKDDSKDLKYVTLDFKSQRSPEESLYCNVEPDQAPKNPKDENVEYAIVARS